MNEINTPKTPIRNGQSLVTQYIFYEEGTIDPATGIGTPIDITGLPVTAQTKLKSQAAVIVSGSVSDGPSGTALATIAYAVADFDSTIRAGKAKPIGSGKYVVEMNVQFFAGSYKGEPLVAYIGENVPDVPTASDQII